MAQSYTPGLKVSPQTTLRVRRQLPIAGTVHVRQGDVVAAQDVVAEASIPGDVFPVNLANQLGVSAGDVSRAMLVETGSAVSVGDELARTNGIFGFFRSLTFRGIAGRWNRSRK